MTRGLRDIPHNRRCRECGAGALEIEGIRYHDCPAPAAQQQMEERGMVVTAMRSSRAFSYLRTPCERDYTLMVVPPEGNRRAHDSKVIWVLRQHEQLMELSERRDLKPYISDLALKDAELAAVLIALDAVMPTSTTLKDAELAAVLIALDAVMPTSTTDTVPDTTVRALIEGEEGFYAAAHEAWQAAQRRAVQRLQDAYETRLKEVLSDDAYSRVMRKGFP